MMPTPSGAWIVGCVSVLPNDKLAQKALGYLIQAIAHAFSNQQCRWLAGGDTESSVSSVRRREKLMAPL